MPYRVPALAGILFALLLSSGPAAAQGAVARAQFTSAVVDREPVDSLDTVSASDGRVLFFSEITGMGGREVVHRWEFGGRVMAVVPIEVGADRWRASSSKRLLPAWTGIWQVSVVTDTGEVLGTWTVTVD